MRRVKILCRFSEFALERLFKNREETDVEYKSVHNNATQKEIRHEVRLTFKSYNDINGIDGAIDQTAKDALARLGAAERHALPRLLRRLAVPVHDSKSVTAGESRLTVCKVPIKQAMPDESTARLVAALTDARIIVKTGPQDILKAGAVHGVQADVDDKSEKSARDDKETNGDTFIAIAHQRVFESWKEAREILAVDKNFFRIREEVTSQFRRWKENKRKSELLLPKGLPLDEARQIVKGYGSELDADIRGYVAASNRRAQRGTIIVGATAAVLAVLLMISVALGLVTKNAQQIAASSYLAAKGALGNVITLITTDLLDTKGVEVKTAQHVLSTVDGTIKNLQTVSAGDAELSHIRSQMLYEGAKAYQKKEDWDDAFQSAGASLALLSQITNYGQQSSPPAASTSTPRQWRRQILDEVKADFAFFRAHWKDPFEAVSDGWTLLRRLFTRFFQRNSTPALFASAPPQWRWELSLSLKLVGDLQREHEKYQDARTRFNDAVLVLLPLTNEFSDRDEWALDLSKLYTSIGDLDVIDKDLTAAERGYASSMAIAAKFFERKPDDDTWQRELGWAFKKKGDVNLKKGDSDKAADADSRAKIYLIALHAFENSLCLRRKVSDRDITKTELTRDVSYALDGIGTARTDPGRRRRSTGLL